MRGPDFFAREHQQNVGLHLGLTREQVMSEEFGNHTILAIKAEIAKDMLLTDAFEKYQSLNAVQVEGVQELGLTRKQVMSEGFGNHTILAIKAEIAKDMLLTDAFEKYQSLNAVQVRGRKLGLTRKQVMSEGFGDHTILAIQAEIAKDMPLTEAFEKYQSFNAVQVEGVQELGLTRKQVMSNIIIFGVLLVAGAGLGWALQTGVITAALAGAGAAIVVGLAVVSLIRVVKRALSGPDAFEKYQSLNAVQVEGRKLGLTREQVMSEGFGYQTISAIQAEIAQDMPLTDAFEKYQSLNAVQVEGRKLGLTREQVMSEGFGYQTISAIQAEIAQDMPLTDAFEKYQSLNAVQVEGRKLGLTREQVMSEGFDYHTNSAIKKLQNRMPTLSVIEIFELVKEQSPQQTEDTVKAYLEKTRQPKIPISEMECIRVVVMTGRGFGHQRAAITLMQKLREIGFEGVFDVLCNDKLGQELWSTQNGSMYINDKPLVSAQLKSMIPTYESLSADTTGTKDVPQLGRLRINAFPPEYYLELSMNEKRLDGLFPVNLAVSAANDYSLQGEEMDRLFNAQCYVGLQPTDWYQGRSFVVEQGVLETCHQHLRHAYHPNNLLNLLMLILLNTRM